MRILHILYESKGDYFGTGGVGIRAYEIYKYLKERHDITLLCKKYPGAEDGEIAGLKHLFVGAKSKSLTRTLLSYAYHASLFVNKYGDEFDIVIEDFSPAIPTFLHAFTKKPIILQMQGYTGKLYFRKYNFLYALVLYILEFLRPKFYHNFMFISSETAGRFSVGKGKRIEVIPNGVSNEILNTPIDDGEYILYLGRIDIYGKGLDTLLNAYRELYKEFPGLRLVIAGDGRDRENFERELGALPDEVRKNIEMPGWVSGQEKIEKIRKALFAVLPSRHEVQSIVALEVMACGKALVVSALPEFGFVKETGAGLSFEAGNAISLAHSMKNMLLSNERNEMGQKGRNWVRNSSWDKRALEFEDFLYRVLGK
jgi:glycogen(starch) synthase